jgi:hypothetical protein
MGSGSGGGNFNMGGVSQLKYNSDTNQYEIDKHEFNVYEAKATLKEAKEKYNDLLNRLKSVVTWQKEPINDPLEQNGLRANIYGKPIIDYKGEQVTGINLTRS